VIRNFFKKPQKTNHFHGFLNTAPFLPFLETLFPWDMIAKNVADGIIKAVSIVATNVFTGRMELFIDKHPDVEYTGEYIHHFGSIHPVHAKASAAIPLVFPSVLVDGIAYTDGEFKA
jgi:NTE family protein